MDKMANRHKSTVKIHYFITRQTVPDTSSGGEQEASNVTFHGELVVPMNVMSRVLIKHLHNIF